MNNCVAAIFLLFSNVIRLKHVYQAVCIPKLQTTVQYIVARFSTWLAKGAFTRFSAAMHSCAILQQYVSSPVILQQCIPSVLPYLITEPNLSCCVSAAYNLPCKGCMYPAVSAPNVISHVSAAWNLRRQPRM